MAALSAEMGRDADGADRCDGWPVRGHTYPDRAAVPSTLSRAFRCEHPRTVQYTFLYISHASLGLAVDGGGAEASNRVPMIMSQNGKNIP